MVIDRSTDGFRISGIFEFGVPVLTSLLSVIMTVLPYGLLGSQSVTPLFGLIALFFWSLFRPNMLPPMVVFMVGLYHDLLTTGPLGLWALTYLLIYGYFMDQRSFFVGQKYSDLWLPFLGGLVVALIVVWGVSCLFYLHWLSPVPVLVQGVITFLLYPVWSRVLMFFNRISSNNGW